MLFRKKQIYRSPSAAMLVEEELERSRQRRRAFLWLLLLGVCCGALFGAARFYTHPRSSDAVSRIQIINRGRAVDRSDRLRKTGMADHLAVFRSNEFHRRILAHLPPDLQQQLVGRKLRLGRQSSPVEAGLAGLRSLTVTNELGTDLVAFTFPADQPRLALAVVTAAVDAAQQQMLSFAESRYQLSRNMLLPRLQALATEADELTAAEEQQRRLDGSESDAIPRLQQLASGETSFLGKRARKLQRRAGTADPNAADSDSKQSRTRTPRQSAVLAILAQKILKSQLDEHALATRIQLATQSLQQTGRIPNDLLGSQSSPVLDDLLRREQQQQQAANNLAFTLGPHEPRRQAAEQVLAATRRALAQEQNDTLEAARQELAVRQKALQGYRDLQAQKMRELTNQLAARTKSTFSHTVIDVDLSTVEIEKDLLLARHADTLYSAPGILIIDPPHLQPAEEMPLKRRLKLSIAGGFVIAFGIEALWTFFVLSSWDLRSMESALGLEAVTVYPPATPRPRRRAPWNRPLVQALLAAVSRHQPAGELALKPGPQAFAAATQHLAEVLKADRYRVLLCTSALPQDGRTTILSTLACALAASGDRVLLIDFDLVQPALHMAFDLAAPAGLRQVLSGQTTLEQAVRPSAQAPTLDLLLSGLDRRPEPGSLHSPALRAMLHEALGRYHYILLDVASLATADAYALSPLTDLLLFVARPGKMGFRMRASTRRSLENFQASAGVLLINRF